MKQTNFMICDVKIELDLDGLHTSGS